MKKICNKKGKRNQKIKHKNSQILLLSKDFQLNKNKKEKKEQYLLEMFYQKLKKKIQLNSFQNMERLKNYGLDHFLLTQNLGYQ